MLQATLVQFTLCYLDALTQHTNILNLLLTDYFLLDLPNLVLHRIYNPDVLVS